MADQNFRVKNGLDVGIGGTIITTTPSGLVGIGTTNPTSKLTVGGVVTAVNFIGNLTGTATTATNLSNAGNITTGTISTSRLSGNYNISVSYASTAGIATYATTAGIATLAQNLTGNPSITITDLQVNGNANINGNLSIGGTTVTISASTLTVGDKDVVLGLTTNPTDTTANHGGIAIASTEGSSLVSLQAVGINTLPDTYKQLMWIKSGTFAGLNTDTWISNYPISIGTTVVKTGSRLTVGTGFTVFDTYLDATDIRARNISASGIVTGYSFRPSSGYYQSPNGTNAFYVYDGTGNVAFQGTIGASQINNASGYKALDFSTSSTPIVQVTNGLTVSGVTTSTGGFVGNLTGTATTATNLADAGNITTGTINSARLSGNYNISVSYASTAGIATYATSSGIATYATNAGIATYATSSGIATYATNAGTSTSVIGGIASVTQLSVSGISTLGVTSLSQLYVTGVSTFAGITTHTTSLFGTQASFTGVITATTYYGDGTNLTGLVPNSLNDVNTTSTYYPLLSPTNVGSISSISLSSASLVYNPGTVRLGIGTTNPTQTLDVRGNTLITGNLNVGTGGTIITTTGIGSVGIGSTLPGSTLDVNAPSGYTGSILETKIGGTRYFASGKNSSGFPYTIICPSYGNAIAGEVSWQTTNFGHTLNFSNTGGAYNLTITNQDTNSSIILATSGSFSLGNVTTRPAIFGEANSTLAQRNGTNAQTFRIYNTYTSASQYERAYLGWNNNTFQIGVDTAGISTARQMEFQTGGTTRVAIGTTGFVGIGSTQPGSTLVVNAPSGYTGNLFDVQVGGTSRFLFQENAVASGGTRATHISTPSLNVGSSFNQPALWPGSGASTDGMIFYNKAGNLMTTFSMGSMEIRSSGGANGVVFNIESSNVLGLYNGPAAQTLRVYNTNTNTANNFERANFSWSGNTFIVGTEKGSVGGTARNLYLQTDGITAVAISTTQNVGIGTTIPTAKLDVRGSVNITGNLNAPGNYYVKLARTSNQTITSGADTLIGFSTITDSNSWYTGITTRTTPTVAGTYQVQVMLNWQAGSTTNTAQSNIQLRKNANTFAISIVGIQTFQYSQSACGIVTMNGTTDYIDFTAYTSNPTSQVVTGDAGGLYTKMEMFKIN